MKIRGNKRPWIITVLLLLIIMLLAMCYYRDNMYVSFSQEPGFFEKELRLEIEKGKYGKVYYTLDGTKPTVESTEYTGELILTDATEQPNRESMRMDTSVKFDAELLEQFGIENPGYVIPSYSIDKAYVIRAICVDCFGRTVAETSGTYFVGFEDKEVYEDIAIVSLTTDPDNLWDSKKGIYVTGEKFENFYENKLKDNLGKEEYSLCDFWDANYRGEGPDWEKPCNVVVYDESHNKLIDQDCGLRIQGNGSAAEAQKSFAVFSRNEYSGSEKFSVDLTDSGYFQHKYIFTACGQDQHFKMNDYLVSQCIEDKDYSMLDYRPCMMFLNGEFWGMYFITDAYNAEYLEAHYQVDPEDVILIKNKEIVEGYDFELQEYAEVEEFIGNNDMTIDENYQKACELIDMDSFIDYFVLMHYIGRCGDWPDSNQAMWRTRSVGDGKYQDGKWRYMVFDLNSEESQFLNSEEQHYDNIIHSKMWLQLIENEDFKAKYARAYWGLALNDFLPDTVNEKMFGYFEKYNKPLAASNMRFYGEDYTQQFADRVHEVSYYFGMRKNMAPWLVSFFCGPEYNDEFIEEQ